MSDPRPCRSRAELDAIMAKYRDPAYMAKAVEGAAENILNELYPGDNEPRAPEKIDSYHKVND